MIIITVIYVASRSCVLYLKCFVLQYNAMHQYQGDNFAESSDQRLQERDFARNCLHMESNGPRSVRRQFLQSLFLVVVLRLYEVTVLKTLKLKSMPQLLKMLGGNIKRKNGSSPLDTSL